MGNVTWLNEKEIFYTDDEETYILDIESNKRTMVFNPARGTRSVVLFNNSEIVLIHEASPGDHRPVWQYDNLHVYSIKTRKMYPLDSIGKEEYLADGGIDYEYYVFKYEDIDNVRYLSCVRRTILGIEEQVIWTVNSDDLFQDSLSRAFIPRIVNNNLCLGSMRSQLYLVEGDNSNSIKAYEIQNGGGEAGDFLGDGNLLTSCLLVSEDHNRKMEEGRFLRLGVFNRKGELIQRIKYDVYVLDFGRYLVISPNGTKVLIQGFDEKHQKKIGQETDVHIYEIIYD